MLQVSRYYHSAHAQWDKTLIRSSCIHICCYQFLLSSCLQTWGVGYTAESVTRLGKPVGNTSPRTHKGAVTPAGQEWWGKQEGNVSQLVDTNCWMCSSGTEIQDNVTNSLPGLKGTGRPRPVSQWTAQTWKDNNVQQFWWADNCSSQAQNEGGLNLLLFY